MLQFMAFIAIYVTCGSLRDAIDVWHCSRFYTMHKSPVLLFQKLNISAFNALGGWRHAIDSIDVTATGPFY